MKERLIDEKPKKLTTTCGNKWKSLRGKKKRKDEIAWADLGNFS